MVKYRRFPEAIQHLEIATRLDPMQSAAYRNLSYAYQRLGRKTEACENLRRAVELLPRDIAIRADYAFALLGAGRQTEGAAQLEYIIRVAPNTPEAALAAKLLRKLR